MHSASPSSPEPARPSLWRRNVVLFGAPTVWAAQMMLLEGLWSFTCYPKRAPLSAPLWDWLMPASIAICFACFVGAALSVRVAYGALRNDSRQWERGKEHDAGAKVGRARFLTRVGFGGSLLFFIAVVFTSCAILFVGSCQAL